MEECESEIEKLLMNMKDYQLTEGVITTVFVFSILGFGFYLTRGLESKSSITLHKNLDQRINISVIFSIILLIIVFLCVSWGLMGSYNLEKKQDRTGIQKSICSLTIIVVSTMYILFNIGKVSHLTLLEKEIVSISQPTGKIKYILSSPISMIIIFLIWLYFIMVLVKSASVDDFDYSIIDNRTLIKEFDRANSFTKLIFKIELSLAAIFIILYVVFFIQQQMKEKGLSFEFDVEDVAKVSTDVKSVLANIFFIFAIAFMVTINRRLEDVEYLETTTTNKLEKQRKLSISVIFTNILFIIPLIVFLIISIVVIYNKNKTYFKTNLGKTSFGFMLTIFIILLCSVCSIVQLISMSFHIKAIQKAKKLIKEKNNNQ